MCTVAVTANPPAANPTPQSRSNPIHNPQGKVSERCVTAPSPCV